MDKDNTMHCMRDFFKEDIVDKVGNIGERRKGFMDNEHVIFVACLASPLKPTTMSHGASRPVSILIISDQDILKPGIGP